MTDFTKGEGLTGGLDLTFESLTWKQLPDELFESIGGRKEAKKQRDLILGKSVHKVVATETADTESKANTETDKSDESKKRPRDEDVIETEQSDKGGSSGVGDRGLSTSIRATGFNSFKSSLPIFKPMKFRKEATSFENICSISWNLIGSK